jgi:hypothetical protein
MLYPVQALSIAPRCWKHGEEAAQLRNCTEGLASPAPLTSSTLNQINAVRCLAD